MRNSKIKKSEREPVHVKVCPVCASLNITLWQGASLGVQYFCKKCGYHGPLVIEEIREHDHRGKT